MLLVLFDRYQVMKEEREYRKAINWFILPNIPHHYLSIKPCSNLTIYLEKEREREGGRERLKKENKKQLYVKQ